MLHHDKPLVVQSDRSVLVDVDNPLYEEARDRLARFAELVKSPERVHTYRITPLSLWNAAAAGISHHQMIDTLRRYGQYDLPENVRKDIVDYVGRYGRIKLERQDGQLVLLSPDDALLAEISQHSHMRPFEPVRVDKNTLRIHPRYRGLVKQTLVKIGFPVEDLAGYESGAPLEINLRDGRRSDGAPFSLRRYQQEAVAMFHAGGSRRGGSGVVVLPCAAGKTMVGIGAMEKVQAETLIISTNTVAVRQWIDELLDKTLVPAGTIGEYTGLLKQVRPVTITTYQCLTYRPSRNEDFPHLRVFDANNWGLIIYDEVHLLPAPVFRVTADIQARRRLGLTATLVREDGREDDVFSLIGPKKYDVPWKELERQGWIARATCCELRLPMPVERRMEYARASEKAKYRVAAENPRKTEVVMRLLEKHKGHNVLIIGQYIDQLKTISGLVGAPIITGKTRVEERQDLYGRFKRGELKVLVVSKVANFAIDLPDANVAVQVSGTFGSRQEEAQRLGRILRPKPGENQAYFYSLVTRDTADQHFAAKRQLFLTEQGYRYTIADAL